MRIHVWRHEAEQMAEAHSRGLHDDMAREFCPDCEGKMLIEYPIKPPETRNESLSAAAVWMKLGADKAVAGRVADAINCCHMAIRHLEAAARQP